MDGLIWNVRGHPEWVLKELVNPIAEWSKEAKVEIGRTQTAAEAGLGPKVIETKECGKISVGYGTEGKTAPHWVGWIVMEKITPATPPPGSNPAVETQRLKRELTALGIRGWDDNRANVIFGTTASHPTPKWWAIDFA
jgi:hypothetical protein